MDNIKTSSLYCEQFEDITKRIVKEQKASISMVQRLFKVSFPKAKAYIEKLENLGYIEKIGRYYKVLISQKDFNNLK
mgnify:FL=1